MDRTSVSSETQQLSPLRYPLYDSQVPNALGKSAQHSYAVPIELSHFHLPFRGVLRLIAHCTKLLSIVHQRSINCQCPLSRATFSCSSEINQLPLPMIGDIFNCPFQTALYWRYIFNCPLEHFNLDCPMIWDNFIAPLSKSTLTAHDLWHFSIAPSSPTSLFSTAFLSTSTLTASYLNIYLSQKSQ